MLKSAPESALKQAIEKLEQQRQEEYLQLKEQFSITLESLKPVNIIKSSVQDIAKTFEIKKSVNNTTANLAAGFLSQIVLNRIGKHPLIKIAGKVAVFGVTKFLVKHPDAAKNIASRIAGLFSRKHKADPEDKYLPY